MASQEIIVVDDGSRIDQTTVVGDRSEVRYIHHQTRQGIAVSRNEGTAVASGEVFAFFDAHQLVEGSSLSDCTALANSTQSIVCPDIADFDSEERRHGAYFSMTSDRGCFSAEWKQKKPLGGFGRVSSLKAPAYFIPKSIYPMVRWNPMQRGWGGSEAMISLKAFFAGIPILHLCGPLIRHKFKTSFHYHVGWDEVWRNHAIIARTCFEESTWYDYWLPQVFESHLSASTLKELDSAEMLAERKEFARYKVRSDAEFWTDLIYKEVPPQIRS